MHDFYQHFKYQNIMTEDVVAYFNQHTGMNLTPIFNQYLRHAADSAPGAVVRRGAGHGDVQVGRRRGGLRHAGRVGTPGHWQIIHPTTKWQWMQTPLAKDDFQVRRICITWM